MLFGANIVLKDQKDFLPTSRAAHGEYCLDIVVNWVNSTKKCGSNSNQCVSATIKQECGKETDGDLASYFPRKSMSPNKRIKGCWDDNQTKNLQDMIIACGGKVDVKTCQGEDYCNADPLPPPIATEMIAVVVVIAVVVMILGFLTWGCWRHKKACFSKKGSMPISTDAEIDLSSSDD
jgi:hypothetical protein